jgi:hypothetical protein
MSSIRRSAWSVWLLVLVVLAGCRRREEGPEAPGAATGEIRTEAVAGDLPAGASVVVSAFQLDSLWYRFKATQFYTQTRAIPELQRALSPESNPQLNQALQEFQRRFGMPLNEQTIFGTLGDKLQLGLYPVEGDTSAQRVVLVADMEDRDALGSILTGLRTDAEAKGVQYRNEQLRGVDVTVVSDSAGAVRALYGFHKEKFVAASDQAALESAVGALDGDGDTMADDSLYARSLGHVGDANLTVFVNTSGVRNLVAAMQRAQGAGGDTAAAHEAAAALELMQKYNLQRATIVGAGWTEDGLEVASFNVLDPSAAGAAPLREMLETPPSEIEVVGYFPDSTMAFYAVNLLDAPAIYDFVVAYAKDAARAAGGASGGDAAAQVDQGIAQFESRTGMNVRTDVLGWMGREAALGLTGVVRGGFFPVPEIALVVQAQDAAAATAFFGKLENVVVQQAQQAGQFPLAFQSEEHNGVTIRFAPTPMGEGLAPAYAVHDDYAIVALSRTSLRRMLDTKGAAGGGVAANPQFQQFGDYLPDRANAVGFANVAQILGEVRQAVTTFQQMGATGAQGGDTMTRVIDALSNLQAVGGYAVSDETGIEQRFLLRIR